MKRLHLTLGESNCPIYVGHGLLEKAGTLLAARGFTSPPIVVTNSRILGLHGRSLVRSLEATFGKSTFVRVGDGEKYKSHKTLLKIYDAMFRCKADRRSWILAFGGGVISDLAGFAAATFMRGISYATLPTTLLAQVDSSVGGKVGINVPQGKNLIGAFHQPSAVLSDVSLLQTLDRREFASGLFEVVKCGAIRSRKLLEFLEGQLSRILARQPEAMQHIVLEACRIKAAVVKRDEREQGLRMILNFGHTVGHALEAATGYRVFRHGEAVAWGMVAAVDYSRLLGLIRAHEVARLRQLIDGIGERPSLQGFSFQDFWKALTHDKKSRGGRIQMVLLTRLGRSAIQPDIESRHLKKYLNSFILNDGNIG